MKIGAEYIYSVEKRMLDITAAAPLLPLGQVAIAIARLSFLPADVESIITQERLGTNNQVFSIDKIRTIDDETEQPFHNRLAFIFRGAGIDELPQAKQIIKGQMSVVGARPIPSSFRSTLFEQVSDDNEGHDLIDRYMNTVALARPGLVSTSGIRTHTGNHADADERLALDIEDYENASTFHDLSLIGAYVLSLTKGKLIDSTVHTISSTKNP